MIDVAMFEPHAVAISCIFVQAHPYRHAIGSGALRQFAPKVK
jgi:hypothetical protein